MEVLSTQKTWGCIDGRFRLDWPAGRCPSRFAFNRHVGSRPERAREYYVLTLIIAALIYVVLAFLGGASDWAILVEACGVLVFGVFVLLSVTHDPRWLGIGWLLHPVWDLVLHAPHRPVDARPRVVCVGLPRI